MRKNFNSVQMFKSSEVCKKFSKSVSYETLVGETATICTDIKQNQRLSEGSADKPLTAVGTLTSLLCNSAKVMEKLLRHVITRRTSVRRGYLPEQGTHANKESLFTSVTWLMRLPRRIQRMLLVMTIPVLALIFTIITTAESQAEVISCVNGKYADGTVCEKCGDNCNWSLDTVSGKLSVSGSGSMYDYGMPVEGSSIDRPWKGLRITEVDVRGVNNVGSMAFFDLSSIRNINLGDTIEIIDSWAFTNANLGTVDIPNSVKKIGAYAFANTYLTEIKLSDQLEYTGTGAFQTNYIDNIILPDSLKTVGVDAFNMKNGNYPEIICQGNNQSCAYLEGRLNNYKINTADGQEKHPLFLSRYADDHECNSSHYYWSGTSCNNKKNGIKCAEDWKRNEDFCNRIRYTPAEAAKVLRDDNTNSVTITFKK